MSSVGATTLVFMADGARAQKDLLEHGRAADDTTFGEKFLRM